MDAYIVAAYRSAVGKAPRGKFRFTRPDDLAADVIKHLMQSLPGLDKERVDDVIVGNAMPVRNTTIESDLTGVVEMPVTGFGHR